MKRLLAVVALILFSAIPSKAQTTTTFSITVVAPPTCTVTLVPTAISKSGATIYSGQANTIGFNISACTPASSTATATFDGTAITVTYTAASGTTAASLSALVTAAESTVGTHSLILTIPNPVQALSLPTPNVTLPNEAVGTSLSVSLVTLTGVTGGVPPYTWTLSSGSLPAGVSLSSSGLVSGTPSSAGSGSFGFTVTDSSGVALTVRRLLFS